MGTDLSFPHTQQDYRPGTSRADVEAEQRRQRRLDGRGGAAVDEDDQAAAAAGGGSGRRAGRWEPMAADPVTGQNADGSFSRTRASDVKDITGVEVRFSGSPVLRGGGGSGDWTPPGLQPRAGPCIPRSRQTVRTSQSVLTDACRFERLVRQPSCAMRWTTLSQECSAVERLA